MANEYSVDTCVALAERFRQAGVHRPMHIGRYQEGDELAYEVTGVVPARLASVRLEVEKFVGGGFAGQVYRVRLKEIDSPEGPISGLTVGGVYAVKILLPPSGSSLLFRNAVYAVGFQSAFSLRVNPAAACAGALWQKFIRRAAGLKFGDDLAVVDILATFVDGRLGSCGEISEWVDGRVWRFEVDDNIDARKRFTSDTQQAAAGGSQEYCAKKIFMSEFVGMLHEMGAHEFARQYEWWTCKSQPNVLKRRDTDGDAAAGLTAVDFRAGLALLPFLPMSPGDFKLIGKGLARGSLVQFDRGDLSRLSRYVADRGEHFADMSEAMDELQAAEQDYRNSQVDVTHHHVRLLYSGRLWRGILSGAVTGWEVANVTDEAATRRLRSSRTLALLFAVLSAIAPLSITAAAAFVIAGAFIGFPAPITWTIAALAATAWVSRAIRRLLGRNDYRRHIAAIFTSHGYLTRAIRAKTAERLISWHRAGRVDAARATYLADRPLLFALHLPLSVLPAGLHRTLTDWRFAREKLRYIFVRPVQLYFNSAAREQWLHEMVAEGKRNGMLSGEDARQIESRMHEPFIQKYLKSLAVHICTLPVTQVVSMIVAIVYVCRHPELSVGQAWAAAGLILIAFQLTPVSPGSLVRGLYVVYLVIRERNFKDYNIAVFLGFFKYVGYLAFPIQMAYHYPALARFMAAHWATGAVHIMPVFGERGALMEHGVFDLFYNRPLTIRRKMRKRSELRSGMPGRIWHALPIAAAGVALMAGGDWLWTTITLHHWSAAGANLLCWATILLSAALAPLLIGACTTVWAGGVPLLRRVALSASAGAVAGACSAAVAGVILHYSAGECSALPAATLLGEFTIQGLWRVMVFALVAVIGALLTEINLPEPRG